MSSASLHNPVVDDHGDVTDEDVRAHVARAQRHTLVLLYAGAHRAQPPDEVEAIQRAHLRHLVGLHEHGYLVINGPVDDPSGQLRGVSLYRSADQQRVRAWVDADPAVQSGRLRAELLEWFGVLPD